MKATIMPNSISYLPFSHLVHAKARVPLDHLFGFKPAAYQDSEKGSRRKVTEAPWAHTKIVLNPQSLQILSMH
jgi:hypothetical protein